MYHCLLLALLHVYGYCVGVSVSVYDQVFMQMWVCICAGVFVHASLAVEGVHAYVCACVAFLHTHRQLRLCTAADPQRGVLGAA